MLAYIIRICENNLLLCAHRHGVPDEQTRLRIECDLPKYTDILANRIAKWQKDTGVVFRWNGILRMVCADVDVGMLTIAVDP